jgi:predicted Zn-dependent protease
LLASSCLISRSREGELSRDEVQQIAHSMGIYEDEALGAYVRSVGDRLAKHTGYSEIDWTFQIVDTPEPNAFALPGGYVYVSRGLLALVNDEDELAGVMGHEIGHVTARHAVKRIGVASPFAIVTGLAGFATGIVSSRLSKVVVDTTQTITGGLVVAPFSRSQESEADKIGVKLAADAGWDPAALSQFLDTLASDEALAHGERTGMNFLATHPATDKRVKETAELAEAITWQPVAPIAADRAALLAKLDGLIIGQDAAGGVFVEQRFLQPEMHFAIDFPDTWKTQNARNGVYGVDPSETAMVGLELAGEGDDPRKVLVEAQQRSQSQPPPLTDLEIGDIPAVHTSTQVRTSAGVRSLEIVWLAYRGLIYQLYLATTPGHESQFSATFEQMFMSFAPLQEAEVAQIREARLHSVLPRSGESLEALVARNESDWEVAMVVVANAIQSDAPLESGRLVKLSIPQAYEPRK